MSEDTNLVPAEPAKPRALDAFDRRILGVLAADSSQSYASIGASVGLSAPAVHERVKKLKASGVIRSTSAILDGAKSGKPVLAFIHVSFTGWGKSQRLGEIGAYPEVEEMHSVAGDAGLIIKARAESAHALECLLAKLYELHGVNGTKTYIALSTFLERPVQAEITEHWDVDLLPPD